MTTSQEADTINQAATDPAPEMPAPFNGETELLRGLHQETDDIDTWHETATVRELNGADEEYLASVEDKEGLTYTEYMTAMLARAVLTVGDIDVQAHTSVLDKLILPDRDMLFLALLRATYGKTRRLRVMCGLCKESNDVEIDLEEDFPILGKDLEYRNPIEVVTSKGVVKLRMPNGEDTIAVQEQPPAKKGQKEPEELSEAQINTRMLAQLALWDDVDDAPEDREEWARGLTISDRKLLVSTLLSIEAGPDMGAVETQCAECGEDMPILLDWVSLLLG